MNQIYERAKDNKLTSIDRWGTGHSHHPMSIEIIRFLMEHDFNDYGDYFGWKFGGDGDNGETLAYQLDAYFEQKDIDNGKMEP